MSTAAGMPYSCVCSTGSVGRLNMSSMRCVMVKPPPMLMADVNTAVAARACAVSCGNTPPPASIMPPTAVRPDTALVTDMSGECSAGVTPHTVWYPQMEASPNLVSMEENAGLGAAAPTASRPPRAPAVTYALRRVAGSRSMGASVFSPTGSLGLAAGTAGGGGGGHMSWPASSTSAPRMTGSLAKSTRNSPFFCVVKGPSAVINLVMLLE
mmetsp:Transcript_8951/g.22147  ORF Transcript_8951/g.22147 Transcript_8951/m.22147 type:complete len:211 (+) Transcript_8951:1955-2587(+)